MNKCDFWTKLKSLYSRLNFSLGLNTYRVYRPLKFTIKNYDSIYILDFFPFTKTNRETDNDVWYYSSKAQFEELLHILDHDHWERDLCQALAESKSEILDHMSITEKLTNDTRGNLKSSLQRSNGTCIQALWCIR